MVDDFDMTEIRQIFIQESLEGLDVMESGLLNLDLGAADPETMNSIFRAAHSIKGGGATFGFVEISEFTHHVETLLDRMRKGESPVTEDAVQVLLQSVDCMRGMVDCLTADQPIDTTRAREIQTALQSILDGGGPADPKAASASSASAGSHGPAPSPAAAPVGWLIDFQPHADMFRSCNDPLRIFRELGRLGDLKVECFGAEVLDFATLDPESCHLAWQLTLTGPATRAQVMDVFAWVESECELAIAPLTPAGTDAAQAPLPNVVVFEQPPAAFPAAATAAPTPPTPDPVPTAATPLAESADAATLERATARKTGAAPDASIRVSIDKVDTLINLVGELVITQSMLARFGDDFDLTQIEKLREGLAQLTRSTRELQENAMQIRMLPIRTSFNRFPRLVHDLSRKLGKQVELRLNGEDTELDKTVLEKIADPLVHLVRNSLDHGLEKPEVRRAAGKPASGTLELSACYEGGCVVIEVRDDGAGINRARVLAKARKNGVVGVDEELSDDRINNLIFAPGFSTAEVISDVSGRGVGLDVVRRNIQDLGGHVQVESREGVGTVFRVRLPLTLAILDGQLARVGDEIYVFPLLSIVETIQLKSERVSRIAGRSELYRVRDEYLPIVRLASLFNVPGAASENSGGLLVVAESDGERVGLMVDDLLGQQQVVIKSLQANFRPVAGFTGATILGDGTVALILDVPGVIALGRASAGGAGRPQGAESLFKDITNLAAMEPGA